MWFVGMTLIPHFGCETMDCKTIKAQDLVCKGRAEVAEISCPFSKGGQFLPAPHSSASPAGTSDLGYPDENLIFKKVSFSSAGLEVS